MYLSYLLIDTAAPSHPRPGRRWVQNPYRVHQRLCMAFPSDERKYRDEEFVARYLPDDFKPVHVQRAEDRGFLFRVDPRVGHTPSRHVVIVQSALKPDWDYAFHNAPELLIGVNRVDTFDPNCAPGAKLRFWLRANPTKRLCRGSPGSDGQPIDPKWIGKRVGLYGEDEQRKWLDRQAAVGGFRVVDVRINPDGLAHSRKDDKDDPRKTHRITLASVRFEGTLEVTDSGAFRAAVIAGIGPGKGLGFGLLSIVPTGG